MFKKSKYMTDPIRAQRACVFLHRGVNIPKKLFKRLLKGVEGLLKDILIGGRYGKK